MQLAFIVKFIIQLVNVLFFKRQRQACSRAFADINTVCQCKAVRFDLLRPEVLVIRLFLTGRL